MFKRIGGYVSVALVIVVVLFPALARAQDYRLGPDDVLEITVYREDELYREIRISSNGSISFPLLGEVKAAGLTTNELEKTLEEKLTKYMKKPQVTVFIKEYSTITKTKYFITSRVTLAMALLQIMGVKSI